MSVAVSTIFRFVTVRNPRKPTKREMGSGFVRYPGALKAPLVQQVAELKNQQLPSGQPVRAGLLQLIGKYRDGGDYLRSPADVESRLPDLASFAEWLAENAATVTAASLGKRLEPPPQFDESVEQLLWDNLVAHTFAGGMPETRESIVVALRAVHLLRFARENDVDDALARRLARASVLLPSDVQVNPEHTDRPPEPPVPDPNEETLKAARARLAKYEAAHADVSTQYRAAIAAARAQDVPPPRVPRMRDGCMEPPPPGGTVTFGSIDAEAMKNVSKETQDVLAELRIGSGQRVPTVLRALAEAAAKEGRTIWAQVAPTTRVVYANGSLWTMQTSPTHGHGQDRQPDDGRIDVEYGGMYDRDRCRVKPLGIGDFRRVEQQIWCYEPGEVAHIENVMIGETRERDTRFLRRTEQIFITETEEETTKERDTQTTDRFEIEKETEKVVEDEISFDLGVQVTAQYGVVKIQADTNFALDHSTSESDKASSKYAKEVTEKALERVVKRVREKQIQKILEEYEETNKHRFDNSGGANHIVGLYRWVDKIYLAKIVNYGKRLMLEFMVPEPAAFHLYAMTESPVESSLSIEKPVDPRSNDVLLKFGVSPLTSHKQLNATNYAFWAAAYDAKVEPAPEEFSTVAKGYNREGMDQGVEFSDSKNDLKLPVGYQAYSFGCNYGFHSEGSNWITVMVGQASAFSNSGGGFGGSLPGEDDFVPIVVMGKTKMYGLTVEVTCQVKPEHTEEWQLETFAAILQGYRDKLSAYQTALAEARVQAGNSNIKGTNPLLNRQTEQMELKKGCIRLMDPHCDPLASEAMKDNRDCNYPEFDCCEAIRDGRYVQFLEQAIEWKLMTYLFYPYFWGRKCNWKKIYQISDPDPLFQGFLQAGYARVVVPVRENYDDAVLRFLIDGKPWNGGSTPGVDSPLYVAIANEMKEPVGTVDPDVEPWEIRVPTTLTVLQCDSGCVPGSGLPCARDGKP